MNLEYRGQPHGPDFPSAAAARAFVAFVEQRTGLEWHQQSEATLERLKGVWERERRVA